MQNFKYFLLIAAITYSFSYAHHQFTRELSQMNALTVRKLADPPHGLTVYTIDQLIRTIYLHNAVPHHTLLFINNTYFMVYRGIELYDHDKKVFIFSRGYAKTKEPGTNDNFIQRGAAAKAAHIQLQDHIVPDNYPLISFDYDDGRYGFAFGQRKEIETLQTLYQAVLHRNPHIDVILIGDCRGAKVALEIATKRPKNLRALILMAPFVSGRDLTNNIAMHHLKYLPFSKEILHRFFTVYFKNYKQRLDTLAQRLHTIDHTIPIFIGHRIYDELISTESINRLIQTLRQSGNKHIHLVTTQDKSEPHSKLTEIPEIQQGIAQFMDMHGLI
ncbi:MAG TPA: alpha/beta hydrolase [Candidatus Babeliales bacterium]|nr:alpha/beta hydrolase [Candidatus Babeliales bacterium]